MKALGSLAVLVCVGAVVATAAEPVTLTGIVSDRTCGLDHHGRDAQQCVRTCVEESGDYVLVVGSRTYTLVAEDEAKAELYELAGKQATVAGQRSAGDVVSVATVKPASKP
jgi:hypothetical protein